MTRWRNYGGSFLETEGRYKGDTECAWEASSRSRTAVTGTRRPSPDAQPARRGHKARRAAGRLLA